MLASVQAIAMTVCLARYDMRHARMSPISLRYEQNARHDAESYLDVGSGREHVDP